MNARALARNEALAVQRAIGCAITAPPSAFPGEAEARRSGASPDYLAIAKHLKALRAGKRQGGCDHGEALADQSLERPHPRRFYRMVFDFCRGLD
jgi:hypothetical protein